MDEEPASVIGAKTMTQMLKLLKPLGAGKYKKLLLARPFSSTRMKSHACNISKHMDLHHDFLMVQDRRSLQTARPRHTQIVAALLGGQFGALLRGKRFFPLFPELVKRPTTRCNAKAYSPLCNNIQPR